MAEASRFRRRSRSASDSAEAGVENSAGVFEVEGSLDIASAVKDMSTKRRRRTRPEMTQPMAATLRSLKRPLSTNLQCTRYFSSSRCAYRLGLGTSPYLNRLHQQRAHRATLWRKGTLLYMPLSTHKLPSTKSPRARLVSARELYAQRNRSLFMYTSAVVSTRFVSRHAISHILNHR